MSNLIKAYYIEWEDHCMLTSSGGSSWFDFANMDNKPCLIKTVGFVVKEDAKCITVCSCYDATTAPEISSIKGVSVILKSCIVKKKRITI